MTGTPGAFCSQCGEARQGGAAFCPACGRGYDAAVRSPQQAAAVAGLPSPETRREPAQAVSAPAIRVSSSRLKVLVAALALLALVGIFFIGYSALRSGGTTTSAPTTSWVDFKAHMTPAILAFSLKVSAITSASGIIDASDYAAQQIAWMDIHQPADCYRFVWTQERSAFVDLEKAGDYAKNGDTATALGLLRIGLQEMDKPANLTYEADAACT